LVSPSDRFEPIKTVEVKVVVQFEPVGIRLENVEVGG
jgi:hypothetical protein